METPTLIALRDALLPLARAAGDAILAVYATDFAVRGKADASPVTEADERAEAVILAGLARLTPDIPVVAEEAVAAGRIPRVGERFWLVDPLDGTKEFINRNGEFTVNIALIEDGRPVLGVVFAPALDRLFAGGRGRRCLRRGLRCATRHRLSQGARGGPDRGRQPLARRRDGAGSFPRRAHGG
jgi:3'(2'), 5'-bisphosphate nucleotidase